MKKRLFGLLSVLLPLATFLLGGCASRQEHSLRIIHTTDLHGNVFPTDFKALRPTSGGMSRLASFLKAARSDRSELLLFDGGDVLQGDPTAYYYNYMDTTGTHLFSRAMNYLRYDAAIPGNHDIETGHAVYDKWVAGCDFPFLAANAIDTETGKPYWAPYKVFDRNGLRVALLGFITPAIPEWLPQSLWTGMRFDDIIESAKYWVPFVIQEEKPDFVVCVLHSGRENDNSNYLEDAGMTLAREVAGIDVLLLGHDHREYSRRVKGAEADSVLVLNPANHLDKVSDVRLSLARKGDKVLHKRVEGGLTDISRLTPDSAFMAHFSSDEAAVRRFVNEPMCVSSTEISSADALFGPSPFMDLIHHVMLSESGADISFAAPLSINTDLPADSIYMYHMFAIYPYENFLCTMQMTGREIRDYLEFSYSRWVADPTRQNGHLILLKKDVVASDRFKTMYPSFNYSAAGGLRYTVDVTKPIGERVLITGVRDKMSGQGVYKPFVLDSVYTVALNSYRANGGGGLMTEGAGIAPEELHSRLKNSTAVDIRQALIRYVRRTGRVEVPPVCDWQFVPTGSVKEAIARDRKFLFDKRKKITR